MRIRQSGVLHSHVVAASVLQNGLFQVDFLKQTRTKAPICHQQHLNSPSPALPTFTKQITTSQKNHQVLPLQLKRTAKGLAHIHNNKQTNEAKVKLILIATKQVMSLKIIYWVS